MLVGGDSVMMELGVGILGFGFMGRTHTHGLINLPLYYEPLPFRIKHISVCNPSKKKRELAEATGYYRRVEEDYRSLVEDPEIDVVCVSSPNGFHREQLVAAIAAGKHVYCDKPIVGNLSEARTVLDAMEGYEGKHQMVLQYRFFPATMRAKQLVDAGFLGRVAHYRAAYLHSSNIDAKKPLAWKSDKRRGGGGVLFDMGVHVLDLMTHLLGGIESLNAASTTYHKERPAADTGEMVPVEVDDATLLITRHECGALGLVEASKVATGSCDELRFEIHGEHGAMRFNLMDPNWLEVYDLRDEAGPIGGLRGFKKIECVQQYPKPASGFPHPKFGIGWMRPHMHCIFNLLDCIAHDRMPSPSLYDGIRAQQVLEAGYRSAETGAWVDVGEPIVPV